MPNTRLRERFEHNGAAAFLDYELIAYLLSLAVPHRAAEPMAEKLIARFGGINGLIAADADAVARQVGVGQAGAAIIKVMQATHLRLLNTKIAKCPVLSTWDTLLTYLTADMAFFPIERVRVLHLNSRGVLIRDQVLSDGTIDQAAIYVREVLRKAIDVGSSSLILVHSHPSGEPSPSIQDIELTRKLIVAAKALDILVFDHIIVAGALHTSFRTLGLL